MFNKGKIEDLNAEVLKLNDEVTKLNSTVESLSKFGAMGVLEIKEEISILEQSKSTLTEELLNFRKEILEITGEGFGLSPVYILCVSHAQ